MSLKKFLTSKVFGLNLVLAVLITVAGLWLTMFGLAKYTHHGEAFPTPDFYGLDLKGVKRLAGASELNYTVIDSVFHSSYTPGTVIEQNPEKGHYVKNGRNIFLTIAAVMPEQLPMPKLTDVSLRQARVLLESNGFRVGDVEFVPSEFDNLVLEQKYQGISIDPGVRISRGSLIGLVVGRAAGNQKTVVPELVGMNLEEAKSKLNDLRLTLGAVIYDISIETAEDSAAAVIYRQSPVFNVKEKVELGSSVDVWMDVEEEDGEDVSDDDDFGF